jgi:DNA-binding transcriptional LysR family regulator
MGPAVLPLLAVDPGDPGVDVRPLDPPLPPRRILVGVRRARTRAPAVDRFLELAREVSAAD